MIATAVAFVDAIVEWAAIFLAVATVDATIVAIFDVTKFANNWPAK